MAVPELTLIAGLESPQLCCCHLTPVLSCPVLSCLVHCAPAQAWTLALAWVVLLQLPALYCRHRVAILSVLRLLLAWVGSQSSSCMHSQLLSPKQAQNSPVLAMLVQLLLVTNTVHIPMLAVRLPMPMLLQLLLTAVQPALLFMGGITRGKRTGGMQGCNWVYQLHARVRCMGVAVR